MKELSIEGKATRYDQAIKVAKSKIKNDKDHVLYEDDIIEIFPELKESEDERIRKALIAYFSDEDESYDGIPYPSILAWLEKQSKASKVEQAMREVEEKAEAFTEAHKGETSEEILAQMRGEQKTAWSEDDVKMIGTLIAIFEVNYPDGFYKVNPIGTTNMQGIHSSEIIKWLKSLKDRYTWRPSNEQMEKLQTAIGIVGRLTVTGEHLILLYNDLKKLTE